MHATRYGHPAELGCIVLVLVAIATGGCTTGTTKVSISHGQLKPAIQQRQGVLLVRPFVDHRQEAIYIGNKRNEIGIIVGHFMTKNGERVDVVLTKYFIEALQKAGYNQAVSSLP